MVVDGGASRICTVALASGCFVAESVTRPLTVSGPCLAPALATGDDCRSVAVDRDGNGRHETTSRDAGTSDRTRPGCIRTPAQWWGGPVCEANPRLPRPPNCPAQARPGTS